ncbi:MAG TPA: Gfo/Idh/MocA family oxidoreductase [Candidatus Acidoferrales bacterium]|jgi:predicted dehydrogenase|nr:Gfo/Idh/MocA family oxidoreductase [Candidatus Acidoferrales bacterium]
MKKVRFGFLSTANIGRKNWNSIHASGNAVVTAVASRDVARSREFIRKMQAETPYETVPTALGSYEELIESPNVDAVYIPLPTGLRKEWVLRAAAAGKHVVCEKPCAPNAADLRQMISACKKNRVQFMDGVMFMHSPRMARLRKVLDDGKSIGHIKRIMTNFSFRMAEDAYDTNVRINSRLEPAGCVGDLGWYNIRFVLWAMKWKTPREVRGRILQQRCAKKGLAPVPIDFSAELIFDGDASAGFYCSFLAQYQNWVHVSGTKGALVVPDFVHGGHGHDQTFELNQKEVTVKCCKCPGRHDDSPAFSQHVNMMRNFAAQIRSGKLNEEWPMWALKTQEVVDECLKSASKH